MSGELSLRRALLLLAAGALCAAGLWLAALAGAEGGETVRKGVYGPDTCDSPSQSVDTKIKSGPKKSTSKAKATFKFEGFFCSNPDGEVEQSTFAFECKLDKEKAKGCDSPQRYNGLKEGKHTFSLDAGFPNSPSGGDPTPDKYKWKIED